MRHGRTCGESCECLVGLRLTIAGFRMYLTLCGIDSKFGDTTESIDRGKSVHEVIVVSD